MSAMKLSGRRSAFTLVEVLVVTGILAILFALATGVAFRVMVNAEEARVIAEMRQLESAITGFKSKFNVSHLPSRFRLYPRISDYFSATNSADPLTKASRDYLFTLWPRLDKTLTINWLPNLASTQPNGIDINGSECMVFFLGGPDGLIGFSKNPANPIPTTGTRGEVSFEFETKRLKPGVFCLRTPGTNGSSVGTTQPSPANVFLDPYQNGEPNDHPYFYFSSNRSGNDYDANDRIDFSATGPYKVIPTSTVNGFRLAPHKDSSGRFHNPNGIQLFSAGRDKRLADIPFSTATPTAGFTPYQNGQFLTNINYSESVDNLCNFHTVKMGIAQ